MHLRLIKYCLLITLITFFTCSSIAQNVYHWFPSFSGTTNNLTGTSGRFCSGYSGTILYTSNSGYNWVSQNSGTSLNLFSIYYNNNYVLTSGQNGLILRSTDMGTSWTQINSGTSNTLYGISRPYTSYYFAVGANGTILFSTDIGISWTVQSSGTSSDLHDVYARGYWAWVVGNSGTLVLTTNTGANWSVKNTGTTADLKSVYFYNYTTGWAVGNFGTIIKSTDGGYNWFSQFSGTSANLNSIDVINGVWICGSDGTVLKTTNGGTNWVIQPAFTLVSLNSVGNGIDNAITVGDSGKIFIRRIDTLYFPRIVFQPNNIRTMFDNTGIFNQNTSITNHPGFEWPAGSNKYAIFTSGLTIAAKINGNLRMAAASYSGEYTPGYIADSSGHKVGKWDERFRFYCIKRGDGPGSTDWDNWGLMVPFGAPYIDVNHNNTYEPAVDTPGIRGAVQTLFICLTDGFTGTHTLGEGFGGGTPPLYAEVHMTAWGYDNPGYQDMQFIKWDIINKNTLPWNNTFFAIVNDPDLGNSIDDYIGCDTTRNLGYCYNADNYDDESGSPYAYGLNPPAVGMRLLNCIGNYEMSLKSFGHFTCTSCPSPVCEHDPNGEPEGAYNFVRGFKKDGTPWVVPNTNPPRTTKFCYSGDPETNTGWTEFGGKIWNCDNQLTGQLEIPVAPWDRRMILNTGSENLTVNPGDTNKVLIAQMIARGSNNLNSVTLLKQLSDVAQRLCDSGFAIGIKQTSSQLPGTFKLYQNYPNPFNPVTNIKYEVPFKTKVTLKIYDVNGREVTILVNGIQNAGSYSADWNGETYASGVYFFRLEAEGFSKSYKMVLLK